MFRRSRESPIEIEVETNTADLSPRLTAEQLRRMAAYGTAERFAPGALLFDEGEKNIDFFVVLSGAVEILQYQKEGFRLVTRPGAGQFIGDSSTITGRAAVVQARVVEDTRRSSGSRPNGFGASWSKTRSCPTFFSGRSWAGGRS